MADRRSRTTTLPENRRRRITREVEIESAAAARMLLRNLAAYHAMPDSEYHPDVLEVVRFLHQFYEAGYDEGFASGARFGHRIGLAERPDQS